MRSQLYIREIVPPSADDAAQVCHDEPPSPRYAEKPSKSPNTKQ